MMYKELIQLILHLFLQISGSILLTYTIITLVVVLVYSLLKSQQPNEQVVQETIDEKPRRKRPYTLKRPKLKPKHEPLISDKPIILIATTETTSYPRFSVKKNIKPDTLTIDTYTKHLQDQLQAYTPINTSNLLEQQFQYGALAQLNHIIAEYNTLEKPYWSIWTSDIDHQLKKLDLWDSITAYDLNELYKQAKEKLYIDEFTKSIGVNDFIMTTLSEINPDQYNVFEMNTTIQIHYDLVIGNIYDNLEFTESMNQYQGRIANITDIIRTDNNLTQYYLDIDYGENIWSKAMFSQL